MSRYFLLLILLCRFLPGQAQVYANSVVSCGSSGICLGGSSCTNTARSVDAADLTNYATMSTGIGVACTRTLTLGFPTSMPSGYYAGFWINTGNVAAVLGNITITTYNGSTPVESASGASLINLLSSGQGFLQFKTSAGSFDRIAISLTAVIGLAQTLDVYYGFTNLTILPVSFTYLDYRQRDDGALLQWVVANGTKSDSFIIERSADGYGFTAMTTISAGGDATYEYLLPPQEAPWYYRIRETGPDGHAVYSKTILVKPASAHFYTTVYPNPVTNDQLQLTIGQASNSLCRIQVINGTGNTVLYREAMLKAGYNTLLIDTKALAAGIYIVRTSAAGQTTTCRFVR